MSGRVSFRKSEDGGARASSGNPGALPQEHEFVLDGQPLQDIWVVDYRGPQSGTIETLSDGAASKVRTLTCGEAYNAFDAVYFPLKPPGAELVDEVVFWCSERNTLETIDVQFRIRPRLEEWDKPWSLAALAEAVAAKVEEDHVIRHWEGDLDSPEHRDWDSGVSFVLPVAVRPETLLQTVWDDAMPHGLRFVREVTVHLGREKRRGNHSVEQMFEFPASVRAACEQYLLYFVQFLRDLGVEADAALTEDASRVLFSVVPRSGPEALEKVRAALDAYLALAENPGAFDTPGPKDVAVQQLSANVLHLRSQLQLAAAVMSAKDAQIEALSFTNAQFRHYALPVSAGPPPVDEEAVVEGVLSVTAYEAKGVRINLPEILRRLKRRLGD